MGAVRVLSHLRVVKVDDDHVDGAAPDEDIVIIFANSCVGARPGFGDCEDEGIVGEQGLKKCFPAKRKRQGSIRTTNVHNVMAGAS